MIIAKLNGQLGNQMFVYATAYAASQARNEKMVVYKFEYDTIYRKQGFQLDSLAIDPVAHYKGIPGSLYRYTLKKIIAKLVNLIFRKQIICVKSNYQDDQVDCIMEKPNTFTELVFNSEKSIHMIEGFRQSPYYFNAFRDEILRQFVPRYQLPEESEKILKRIADERYPVSVHIRRGDYVKIGCCLSMQYYQKAIRQVSITHPESVFFIFSDDIEWVQQNLKCNEYNVIYVKHEQRVRPFDDIWLMSKCRANIIANSSFSWWGAYLNNNENRQIIAPRKIYENNDRIIPEGWVVMDDEIREQAI